MGEMAAIQKEIELKREKYELAFERLDNSKNSKFKIVITTKHEEDEKDYTTMDHLFVFLLNDDEEEEDETLYAFRRFLEREEFDTDCIENEVDHKYGNIENVKMVEALSVFLK